MDFSDFVILGYIFWPFYVVFGRFLKKRPKWAEKYFSDGYKGPVIKYGHPGPGGNLGPRKLFGVFCGVMKFFEKFCGVMKFFGVSKHWVIYYFLIIVRCCYFFSHTLFLCRKFQFLCNIVFRTYIEIYCFLA